VLPERVATPEDVFVSRRRFLASIGMGTVAAASAGLWLTGCTDEAPSRSAAGAAASAAVDPARAASTATYAPGSGPLANVERSPDADLYPARRNPAYTLDRPLTDETRAATYNNFYEFTTTKDEVWELAAKLPVVPWNVQISGLAEHTGTFDVYELTRRFGIEERLYRHRCVEAWSMAIPWSGFPLAKLIEWAQPASDVRFLRFVSFFYPQIAPGQRDRVFPWPYYEALTLAEATNELAFLATGVYGHELPKQHGAPLRLVTPWKYGFKSIKSITKIDFTAKVPTTFWSDAAPSEYDFVANVRPDIPHRRWSQANERLIGTDERRPTLPYNGYAAQVAHLYT